MELTFERLTKRYGTKQALNGVSMTLTEGIYGLLGPNGAGKSTLMNILTGNLPQTSGEIRFNGQEIRAMGSAFRAKVGYMPQQQAFYPGFTAEEFLYYIASLRDLDRACAAQRVDWAVGLVSLREERKKTIRSFSGGMKQRLLLAQALLGAPEILILDEPTAGLDPRQRIAVRNLVSEIAEKKIVLISTHVVPDVEYVSKEILLLSDGRLLRQASAWDLMQEIQGQVWEMSLPESAWKQAERRKRVSSVTRMQHRICVRFLSAEKPESPYEIREVTPTLEDVYLYHFGEEGMR
ncbi:MAG: ATP-binding cassette domain-containing protein [Lachnospiraceae bacterium]|nr:ATP-binding cassette domain-containing protein [Lachnospiraceae bacterium]